MDLKSNEPFWLVKNGILTSYPSLKENEDCDILIVGGGITGSLIAHQCIADGYKTILIDKREIANGSSSATTSMLQYEIDTPLHQLIDMIGEEGAIASYKACSEAIDTLAILCKDIKSKAGFRKKKSLYLASFKKDVDSLKKELEARKDAGFDVTWIEQEHVEQKLGIYQNYGGIFSKQGASVDAFKLVHELLNYNISKGLKVFDKTELMEVSTHKGYSIAQLATGLQLKAKKIIYCTGYESSTMIKEHFVNLLSTYAIVSEVDEITAEKYKDLLLWNTAKPYNYLRTTDDHRILIGGGDEDFSNPIKRDALLKQKSKSLQKDFKKLIPAALFYEDFAWCGTFGETKDGLPYIGTHPDFKNAYFVLGFGGNGITFSVTGMEMVSYWLQNKKHKLSPYFAFGR